MAIRDRLLAMVVFATATLIIMVSGISFKVVANYFQKPAKVRDAELLNIAIIELKFDLIKVPARFVRPVCRSCLL